jgi:hypothetical protein
MRRIVTAAALLLAALSAHAAEFMLFDFDDQAAIEARKGLSVTKEPVTCEFITEGAEGSAVQVSLPGQVMALDAGVE